jgi:hypothetical protein
VRNVPMPPAVRARPPTCHRRRFPPPSRCSAALAATACAARAGLCHTVALAYLPESVAPLSGERLQV